MTAVPPGAGDAIQQAAQAMASAAQSMQQMAASSAQVSANMQSAGAAARGGWGGPALTSAGTSFNVGQVGTAFATGGPVAGTIAALGQAGKVAFGTLKNAAVASYNDLRTGRGQALEYERQRAIARTGTGNFENFQKNLNVAMNAINVQNKNVFTADLAAAYSNYYSQGFGGGQQGEQRTAAAVGGMHTLATIAGVAPEAVGGATNALYDPSTYYKAMAAGVMTRNPVTGDMVSPEEIINQYRNRLAGNTPEEIKRALAPGGMLRAELNQTYGDAALVDMVAKGLVMSAEAGKPMEVGDIQAMAMDTGYARTPWTQGRDSEARKEGEVMNRIAEYTNDVTEGIKTSNNILADINAKIANFDGVMRFIFGAGETLGGIMDTFYTDMPQTAGVLEKTITDALGGLVEAMKSGNPLGAIGPSVALGTAFIGAGIVGAITHGAAEGEPTAPGATYPSSSIDLSTTQPPLPTTVPPLIDTNLQSPSTPGGGSNWVDPNTLGGGTVGTVSANQVIAIDPREMTGELANIQKTSVEGTTTAATPATNTVNMYITVTNASDSEVLQLANRVKSILEADQELTTVGVGALS